MNIDKKMYIPFDQFQRYETVARIINSQRETNSTTFQILEVGAQGLKNMKLFLPNDQILFTDIVLTDAMRRDPDFQEADGTALPFENNSFDFVFATDVLEHVPGDMREKFLLEVSRVARKCAILTFPFSSTNNECTEMRLASYYRSLSKGGSVDWLEEHIMNGLPSLDKINELLIQNNLLYFNFFHGNINIFEKMWYSIFDIMFCAPEAWPYATNINYYYNSNLYDCDVSMNCYRAYYVISNVDLMNLKVEIENWWKPTDVNNVRFLENLLDTEQKLCQFLTIMRIQPKRGIISRGLQCWKEHGIAYTSRRIIEKFLDMFGKNELK